MMPASITVNEVVREFYGLSGFHPEIRTNSGHEFVVFTNLYSVTSAGRYLEHISAADKSADMAVLKTYQRLYEVARTYFIESASSGNRWKYDPETEGWLKP